MKSEVASLGGIVGTNGEANMSSSAYRARSWLLGGEGVLFARFLSSTILFRLKGQVGGSLVDANLLRL